MNQVTSPIEFTKPRRHVRRIFIHCSASSRPSHDDISVIRRWHTDPKPQGRGWSDVGYHFFIKKDGTVQAGRSLERSPAAQKGHNSGTIAICLHGGGGTPPKHDFSAKQDAALQRLCRYINLAYEGYVTFHGHREVANKACPVFDYREVLSLDRFGVMTKNKKRVAVMPAQDVGPPEPMGRDNPALSWWEKLLQLFERRS